MQCLPVMTHTNKTSYVDMVSRIARGLDPHAPDYAAVVRAIAVESAAPAVHAVKGGWSPMESAWFEHGDRMGAPPTAPAHWTARLLASLA